MIRMLAICLLLAGCARGPSEAAQNEARSIKAERDAGRITWSQWASRVTEIGRREGQVRTANDERNAAAIAVIAERVDNKQMTPAEGRLAVANIVANDEDRQNAQAEIARARFGAALQQASSDFGRNLERNQPRQPITTTCRRQFNQVVCDSQ
jgi:hypothetical protein